MRYWTSVPLEPECDPNADNDLLKKYYDNPERWGLTFELSVLTSLVKGLYEKKESHEQGLVYFCSGSFHQVAFRD